MKKISEKVRQHLDRFAIKPHNGHALMRELDEILLEINATKMELKASVDKIEKLTEGVNNNG